VEKAVTTPQIVKPENIESTLKSVWEKLAKEDKMRACLFNLIVFSRSSTRANYTRNIVQKIIEKFPCRLIFISEDLDTSSSHLKTTVSVIMPEGKKGSIACDHIEINASLDKLKEVPNLVLPHIIPDLPITLLWPEDPCAGHILFEPLSKIATRIIFDSESASDLLTFSKKVLEAKKTFHVDIADLNWGRTEAWRDLLTSLFDTDEKIAGLKEINEIKILHNARVSEFFCHTKIQSMYLLAWLSSRLNWKCTQSNKNLTFAFETLKGSIESVEWEQVGPGCILAVDLYTMKGNQIEALRIKERPHLVSIQISSQDKCDLPYNYTLGQTATGQSLVKEICMKGTSQHYLDMLKHLEVLDKDKLC
jgi:glucose-6-phosphate dehydrogenase assembly protein OpcA